MRCSPLKASRAASAVARSCCFDWLDLRAGMQRCVPLSSPAKADDPVFHRAIKPNNCRVILRLKPVIGRAGGEPRWGGVRRPEIQKQTGGAETKSAKDRWPLERSIPEFPTKVGGHHMSGSTDPARDSSLKD